jgi:hypothetical protein
VGDKRHIRVLRPQGLPGFRTHVPEPSPEEMGRGRSSATVPHTQILPTPTSRQGCGEFPQPPPGYRPCLTPQSPIFQLTCAPVSRWSAVRSSTWLGTDFPSARGTVSRWPGIRFSIGLRPGSIRPGPGFPSARGTVSRWTGIRYSSGLRPGARFGYFGISGPGGKGRGTAGLAAYWLSVMAIMLFRRKVSRDVQHRAEFHYSTSCGA